MCTTVAYNTAQKSSENLHSYSPDHDWTVTTESTELRVFKNSRQFGTALQQHTLEILSQLKHNTHTHTISSAAQLVYIYIQHTYICRTLSTDAVKTLVHVLISCHVDYCNSILYGA